jgi:transcriptional regulator with XRE-family HTH domain
VRGSKTSALDREFDMVVGRRIELTRKAVGMSAIVLAGRAGISRSGLYSLESGRTTGTPLMLSRFASEMGVSVAALVPKVQIQSAQKVCEQVCSTLKFSLDAAVELDS